MQEILSPYLWIFTLVYIDDIIIYSRMFEEHLKHIDLVLKAIATSGLTRSPRKCHLGYQSIIVLGNKVSHLGRILIPGMIFHSHHSPIQKPFPPFPGGTGPVSFPGNDSTVFAKRVERYFQSQHIM